MKFIAEKMRKRLISEGNEHLISPEVEEILKKIDGKEAVKNRWKALVEDEIVYEVEADGEYYPVLIVDCEE